MPTSGREEHLGGFRNGTAWSAFSVPPPHVRKSSAISGETEGKLGGSGSWGPADSCSPHLPDRSRSARGSITHFPGCLALGAAEPGPAAASSCLRVPWLVGPALEVPAWVVPGIWGREEHGAQLRAVADGIRAPRWVQPGPLGVCVRQEEMGL